MRIDIITLFPDFFRGPFTESIIKRAIEAKKVEIITHDLRDYTLDKHRKVDDYQYGGGAGMVMMVEPIDRILKKLKSEREYDLVIYTSPDGKKYNQKMANQLSTLDNIIILCGHYKGIDHRVREYLIDMEISIGDYVLTGGETAAIVMTDSIIRLIPGVISDETSALSDSFQDNLLAPPVYTRPAEYNNWKVPDVLLSGHDARIEEWRLDQSLSRTKDLRPDLLNQESDNE